MPAQGQGTPPCAACLFGTAIALGLIAVAVMRAAIALALQPAAVYCKSKPPAASAPANERTWQAGHGAHAWHTAVPWPCTLNRQRREGIQCLLAARPSTMGGPTIDHGQRFLGSSEPPGGQSARGARGGGGGPSIFSPSRPHLDAAHALQTPAPTPIASFQPPHCTLAPCRLRAATHSPTPCPRPFCSAKEGQR